MPHSLYLAGPLGFFEAGKHYHQEVLRPSLEAAGFRVLDPWESAAQTFGAVDVADDRQLRVAARQVGKSNVAMLEECDVVLAVLDGPDVDSGTASEIGYAYSQGKPVVGVLTDLRASADTRISRINLQVEWFIEASGGRIEESLGCALLALAAMMPDMD
jgi:nucleoside 2-deoxyribosyltransferase